MGGIRLAVSWAAFSTFITDITYFQGHSPCSPLSSSPMLAVLALALPPPLVLATPPLSAPQQGGLRMETVLLALEFAVSKTIIHFDTFINALLRFDHNQHLWRHDLHKYHLHQESRVTDLLF